MTQELDIDKATKACLKNTNKIMSAIRKTGNHFDTKDAEAFKYYARSFLDFILIDLYSSDEDCNSKRVFSLDEKINALNEACEYYESIIMGIKNHHVAAEVRELIMSQRNSITYILKDASQKLLCLYDLELNAIRYSDNNELDALNLNKETLDHYYKIKKAKIG